MKKFTLAIITVILFAAIVGFKHTTVEGTGEKIKWMSFEQAVELSKKTPKKIFIDVYTGWCGWCKVMDAQTFTNPVIIKNMNKYFYAVKLDAEMKDSVHFQGNVFINPNPSQRGSTHQLAAALLNNQMSYPTTVYLDENFALLSPVAGFLKPENMEPILKFYGENHYKSTKWEEFSQSFKGEVKAN
jgi:thioredoxin-related protein